MFGPGDMMQGFPGMSQPYFQGGMPPFGMEGSMSGNPFGGYQQF